MIDDPEEEAPEKPVGDLEFLCTLGGQFDLTFASLNFYSPDLDRHEVTRLLGVEPTLAWNAGEPHRLTDSGKIRRVNWGKWIYKTHEDAFHPEPKIEKIFSLCTQDLKVWRLLAEKYETWITVGGKILNFNRELHLTPRVLGLIAERELTLNVDVVYWGDDDEEVDSECT